MSPPFGIERAKWFLYNHFERILVALLVGSLLAIHYFVDLKVEFLSFYYLPIIAAGFFLGRRMAFWSAVLVVGLVGFVFAVDDGTTYGVSLLSLVPWAGFLILTGHVVGLLADQRKARVEDLRQSYLAMLELLAMHLESSEQQNRGHSHQVAERAVSLGKELGMRDAELDDLRVAGLLHELGPQNPRLLRFLAQYPAAESALPAAGSIRSALAIVNDFERYHEVVGPDWPVDSIRLTNGAKILAVADAFETLQAPTPNRPAFAPWNAIEEIEKGAGQTFSTDVVKALRRSASAPEPVEAPVRFSLISGGRR